MSGLLLRISRIAVYFAATLPAMPVQMVFLAINSPRARRFPQAYHRLICRLLGVHLVRRGTMSAHRPTLFVSNHTSYLDIEIMGAAIEGAMNVEVYVELLKKTATPVPRV